MKSSFLIISVLVLSAGAWAQEEGGEAGGGSSDAELASEDEETAEIEERTLKLRDRIRAVSNSTFLKRGRFELEPYGGVSTSDAFYRRWTVGARASFFILEELAIDAGGAFSAFAQQLTPVVLDDGTAPVFADDTQTIGYADASLVVSPFYGKMALMSEWVLHFDMFGSAGVGVVLDGVDSPVDPAMQLGGGLRVVLNRALALRTDVRDYLTLGPNGVDNFVVVNIGLSIFFPFDFENTDRGTKDIEG